MNNQIRFTAYNGESVIAQSDWTPERTKDCALNLLTAFRKLHPDLFYRIERTGDSKERNLRKLTRFQIKDGTDTYYSREFDESEVDAQYAEIRKKWPNAEISAGVRDG